MPGGPREDGDHSLTEVVYVSEEDLERFKWARSINKPEVPRLKLEKADLDILKGDQG